MTIPRHALLPRIVPRHNRLPGGSGLWWPLHGSLVGMDETPTLTELVTAGAAAAGKWTDDALMYSFPADNGGANGVALLAPHNEEDDSIEQVIGLVSAAVGTQVLVGGTVRYGNQLDNGGWWWCYGVNSTYSQLGLSFNTGETLIFQYRAKGASTDTSVTLTLAAGTATSDAAWRDTDVQHVTSIHMTGPLAADVEVRLGNGTLAAHYTGVANFADNGGTAPPGRGTADSSQHPGLLFGGRLGTGPTATNLLGKGAGHSARIGNACARRYAAYASGRALQAVADLLARPDDYPDSWLA